KQPAADGASCSGAMSEAESWKLIEKTDRTALDRGDQERAVKPLLSALKKLSVAKIQSFQNHLTDVLYALDTRAHCNAADIVSDDWFLYVRCYVVAQGRTFYEHVLKDPAKM